MAIRALSQGPIRPSRTGIASLGTLPAAGFGGALVWIGAGPVGPCVGAVAGSAVWLLACAVLSPPCSKAHAEGTPSRFALAASRALRFVGWLAAAVLGLLGVAGALLAVLCAADDGANDQADLVLAVAVVSAVLFALVAAVLSWLRRPESPEPGRPEELDRRLLPGAPEARAFLATR